MATRNTIDVVSPVTVGEDKIVLRVDPRSRLLVNYAITLLVDYSRTESDGSGASAPIVFTVQPEFGDGEGFQRQVFERRPTYVSFVVEHGGSYLCTVRERDHNHWQGRLHVQVLGERPREKRRPPASPVSSLAADRFLSDTLLIDSDGSRMVSG